MPDSDAEEAKPKIPRRRADDYKVVYANASFTALSNWDIQLTFSQVSTTPDSREQVELVTIIQSPTHAKAFLRSFANLVKAYEDSMGPIPEEDEIEAAPPVPAPKTAKKAIRPPRKVS